MRFYYGWRIVGMAMIIQMIVVGATINAFGLFVIPVSDEFGLSRADVNTGLIISNLGGAAMAPFLGRAIDAYPVRLIMAVCAVIFSLGIIGLGLSHSVLLSSALLAAAIPAGLAGLSQLGGLALVARWFEVQRGRAMALAIMGASLGSLLMAPLVGWLIEMFGWRTCLMITGPAIGLIVLTMLFLIRTQPRAEDVEPRPASAAPAPSALPLDTKPKSTREILSMPRLWLLGLGVAFSMGAFQAIMISLVPIAQEGGVSIAQSASLISILGGTAIIGKVALIWVGDYINKALSLAIMFGALSMVFFSLTLSDGYVALMISSALLGLVVGATMPVVLALLADYVGVPSFGSANGILMLMMAGCGAICMRFGGEVYDRTGGYDFMFLTFSAMCAIATLCLAACWHITRRGKSGELGAVPA